MAQQDKLSDGDFAGLLPFRCPSRLSMPMLARRYQLLQRVLNQRQPDLTVMMENVHKSHNLSAVLRTCDAVGVFAVHAVSDRGQVKTFRATALGSQKWVRLQVHSTTEEAIGHLKGEGFKVYAAHLSERAVDFREVDFTQPTAVLLGTEKWGVSDRAAALCDQHIVIPMVGMVESLNVSVANAVILFEAQRQRLAAGMYDQSRIPEADYRRILFEWAYPELARRYRDRNEDYPALDGEGQLLGRGS